MQIQTIIRWTARVWSVVSVIFVGAFLFGEGVPTLWDVILMLFFPFGVLSGLVVGWWREFEGGIIALTSLVIFYVLMFFRSSHWPGGPYFLLIAAPGVLYVVSAMMVRGRRE